MMLKELKRFDFDDTVIYTNDSMMENGLIIKEDTFIGEDVETWISIDYINKVSGIELDSMSLTVYQGTLLAPIQSNRIIKDIYELYNEYNLIEFVEGMDEMSVQKVSSSMQSSESHADSIRDTIEESFKLVRELM